MFIYIGDVSNIGKKVILVLLDLRICWIIIIVWK